MIVDEPASAIAGPSTRPLTPVDNIAVLPYDDLIESSSLLGGGGCKIVYNYLEVTIVL